MERKLLLLGLLRQQEMHGYRLNDFIENNLALCTDIKKPTAYYLLSQMEKDGWLQVEIEQEGQRPPRRVYHLTEEGEKAFQSLLRQALATYQPVNFLGDIALGFLQELPREEAISLLEAQKSMLEQRLQEVENVPTHPSYLSLLFEHQIRFLRFEREWLEQLISRLKEEQK